MIISEFLPQKKPRNMLLLVLIFCMGFYLLFFYPYFLKIERYILSYRTDWLKELSYYLNIKHQIFDLKQFPHYSPYKYQGSNALFANPETSILTPINLLLPLVSLYNFFIFHLSIHYIYSLIGFILLRKILNLPFFSILIMFVLFGLNGRILSNYLVGHSMFITFMWLPLLLYFYLSFMKGEIKNVLFSSSISAFVMTMIFFEGGVHLINWILLFFIFDMILTAGIVFFKEKRVAIKEIVKPLQYYIGTIALFSLFSAVKTLPTWYIYWNNYSPDIIGGYKSTSFFLQSFYKSGLGVSTPFKELWREEAYNFIGKTAFILSGFALIQSIFFNKDLLIKRLAIIAIIFMVLSFSNNYSFLFGNIPLLSAERVGSRFVFISIALLSLLVPLSLTKILSSMHCSRGVQELVMLVLGILIYIQLFLESREWMLNIRQQFNPPTLVSSTYQISKIYELYFYAGLFISLLALLLFCTWILKRWKEDGGQG